MNGDVQTVSALLSRNPDVEAADKTVMTPLMLAARRGNAEAVRLLLGAGALPGRAQEYYEKRALHHAALGECEEAVRALLEAGADPNAVDANGRTPLHYAVRSPDVARALVKAGARSTADYNGLTPMHVSTWSKPSIELLDVLLSAGADVDAQDGHGQTPLHYAASCGAVEQATWLLQHGADPHLKDEQGGTPEDNARRAGLQDIVRLLRRWQRDH